MTDRSMDEHIRCFHWDTSERHRELFWPDIGCPYCEIARLRHELDDLRAQWSADSTSGDSND